MPSHIIPGQVDAGRMGGLEHQHGATRARHFDITPAHHYFARVLRQARWPRKVPDRYLTWPRRCCKPRARLAFPLPVLAGRSNPVGQIAHRFSLINVGLVLGKGFLDRVVLIAIIGGTAARIGP